jgi:hypothetical protein
MSAKTSASSSLEITSQTAAEIPSGSKLFAEDGGIFSQQPGKGVECLRRYDESMLGMLSQPNEVRHNYPSN